MARYLKNRKKTEGKEPGALIFIGKEKMSKSQIELFSYNKERYEEKILEDLPDWTAEGTSTVRWLNLCGLHDTGLIERSGNLTGLSPLALEDILNTDQRPKIMEEEDKLVLFMKEIGFDPLEKRITADHVTMVLGKGYLVTYQEIVGDPFVPVRERIRNNKGRIRSAGADYLAYSLLDTLVDDYIRNIELLGSAMEEMEEQIINERDRETLAQIYHFKKEVGFLRKTIRPVKEIMYYLLKNENGLFSKKTKAYLYDLDDLVNQAIETVEIYFNMANDLINLYHANMSQRVNEVMRTLTIFASIFIPLTFLVGVYGTNFDNLPELHWKYGYFYMWGFMAVAVAFMLLYFRKKKWL